MTRTLQQASIRPVTLEDVSYPFGPIGVRKVVQDALLIHLKTSGLEDPLTVLPYKHRSTQ